MRRVATKIFLAFAVSLLAFSAVAGFGIARLHEVRRDLRLLSGGYLALTRIVAQLDVKDWVATRALEASALDRAARQVYLPVARARFPGFVRDKIEEGRRVARESRAIARGDEARFLDEVSARLDALDARWTEYDARGPRRSSTRSRRARARIRAPALRSRRGRRASASSRRGSRST